MIKRSSWDLTLGIDYRRQAHFLQQGGLAALVAALKFQQIRPGNDADHLVAGHDRQVADVVFKKDLVDVPHRGGQASG